MNLMGLITMGLPYNADNLELITHSHGNSVELFKRRIDLGVLTGHLGTQTNREGVADPRHGTPASFTPRG